MNNRAWITKILFYGNTYFLVPKSIATALLLTAILFVSSYPLSAQLQVSPDRPTGYYELGETARFVINAPSTSGTANYTIHADTRTPNYTSGTVQVNAGQSVTIPYTPSEAGVVTCTVNLNGQFGKASAGIGVYQLDAIENEPSDFDAFWQNQIDRSDAIPLDPRVSLYQTNSTADTYKFSVANIDNRRTHGYMTIPKDGGQYPAMITFPAFGEGANLTTPDEFTTNVLKVISVSLSIHNIDPQNQDPNAYEPNEITNRENYYYKQAIIGAKRVIDYLHTRSEFDGENIILAGVSQGAGLATMVAGLDQRVDLIVQSNPALTRHLGPQYGRPASFPYYIWQSRVQVGTPDHEAATANAAKYYDAIYFAKRYKKPGLMIIGYEDDVTPPDGSFAVHNEWSDKRILLHSLKTGHNHPGEYWNGRFDVIRRFIPSARRPQFPNLGYVANAG
ncbi:MAG: acetylxylan esterase, partial [Saprospiraceae bacterium]